jgi:hypothetical protein
MALSTELRTALERGRSRLRSPKQPSGNGAAQASEHGPSIEELVRQAPAAGHTGPLIIGSPHLQSPGRRNGKGSWRDDARLLEELYPEEFGPPHDPPVPSEKPTPPVEQEPARIAPGPSQNACNVPPAPPPVLELAPLPAVFWQALLYGSPDALLATTDATQATRLVAQRLGVPSVALSEFTESLRAGQLRKLLRDRFGLAAEQTTAALWRSAPASPGTPLPDIAQLPARALPASRSQPQWIAELNKPGGSERAWLIENGLWCG